MGTVAVWWKTNGVTPGKSPRMWESVRPLRVYDTIHSYSLRGRASAVFSAGWNNGTAASRTGAPRGEERGSQRADLLEQQALRLVSARRLAAARVELGRSISARNQNVSPPLLLSSLI